MFLSFCLSVIISFYLSFCLSSSKFIVHCSDQSEACLDDLEVLLGDGIDGCEGYHRSSVFEEHLQKHDQLDSCIV